MTERQEVKDFENIDRTVGEKLRAQVGELTKKLGMSVEEIVAEANQRSFQRMYRDQVHREIQELNKLLAQPSEESSGESQ